MINTNVKKQYPVIRMPNGHPVSSTMYNRGDLHGVIYNNDVEFDDVLLSNITATSTVFANLNVSTNISFNTSSLSSSLANVTVSKLINSTITTTSNITADVNLAYNLSLSLLATGTTTADLTVNAPSAGLLLDLYPNAAAAYSLRKLRTAYTGSAIRVRANTSGAEGDVSFDVNSTISASSTVTVTAVGTSGLSIGQQVTFSTFWNTGGSNQSVFVTTWYDQSGNASNATQTTQANQPQIVGGGILITQNAKATLKYDGSNDYLDAIGVTAGNPKSIFVVTKSNYIGFLEKVLFDSITTNQAILYKSSADIISLGFGTQVATTYTTTLNFILYSVMHNGANSNAFVNSNNQILVNQNLGTNAFNGLRIAGVRGIAPLFYNGNISEFIIYSSNQSTNRSGIETNINTNYGIY